MNGTNTSPSWLNLGAVAAAFGASICCILPVAVVFLGVGSAALGAQLEAFRPYFLVLTAGFVAGAFYFAYRKGPDCGPGEVCAVPANRRRQRILVWIVALAALALVTFPYYIAWIL